MQKPVIQRIKRRAEVCQSLPVTCGHRGNDTGNGLVTVVSLQYAVDCFLENGKSPHSKPFTFLLLPAAKCRLGMFFTHCQTYLCNLVVELGSRHLYRQGDLGTYRHRNHHEVHESNRQDQTDCSQQDPEFIFDEREFRKSFHVNWVFPRNSLSGIRLS